MTTIIMPYFLKNKDWYYYDTNNFEYRLSINAPQEAIDSYNKFYKNTKKKNYYYDCEDKLIELLIKNNISNALSSFVDRSLGSIVELKIMIKYLERCKNFSEENIYFITNKIHNFYKDKFYD